MFSDTFITKLMSKIFNMLYKKYLLIDVYVLLAS